ncbi:hypothetical protein PGT21_025051 [Puccinia graminis f. sp. tritici]|uniref:Uncharacterized protein n=1 Tax=Puccinia graminis f. sp. tritici TaxID=56615 RepID=A0A5B0N9I6_PUCGR|nr:hypothetical protein PGT21_025051 [Puccinia graminis f. sp. tritici]
MAGLRSSLGDSLPALLAPRESFSFDTTMQSTLPTLTLITSIPLSSSSLIKPAICLLDRL